MADTNEIKEMADVIHHELFNFQRSRCEKLAEKLHEADFVKVVRCKDCAWYIEMGGHEYNGRKPRICLCHGKLMYENDYCRYGSRKEQNNDGE